MLSYPSLGLANSGSQGSSEMNRIRRGPKFSRWHLFFHKINL